MRPKLSADTQSSTVFGRGSYAETLRKATSRPRERVARYPKNMHACLQRQLVTLVHLSSKLLCEVRLVLKRLCSFSKEQRARAR